MSESGRHHYRPATVRFYVDADVLGLAKILVQVRADATYPGDPGGDLFKRRREACPITSPATLDPEWIPEVTRRGWLNMLILDASRRHHPEPPLARWCLGAGIAAIVGANLAHGLGHGPIGALVSAWPALALAGSLELLMTLIRTGPYQVGLSVAVAGWRQADAGFEGAGGAVCRLSAAQLARLRAALEPGDQLRAVREPGWRKAGQAAEDVLRGADGLL